MSDLAQALMEADYNALEQETRRQRAALDAVAAVCSKWDERAGRYREVAKAVRDQGGDPTSRLAVAERYEQMARDIRRALNKGSR